MKITREERDGQVLVKIEGAVSIYEGAVLHEEFLECLEKYNGLLLDLSDVSDFDTAAVQLLYSARITATHRQKNFVITGASAAVLDTVKLAGLDPEKSLHISLKLNPK
jgi:anti-sigma B factor antagonist